MERWFRVAWWSGCAVLCLLVWLAHWNGPEKLWGWISGQTAAAWVQAVGSVAAIVASIAVVQLQHRRELQAAARADAQRTQQVLHDAAELLDHAYLRMQAVGQTLVDEETMKATGLLNFVREMCRMHARVRAQGIDSTNATSG